MCKMGKVSLDKTIRDTVYIRNITIVYSLVKPYSTVHLCATYLKVSTFQMTCISHLLLSYRVGLKIEDAVMCAKILHMFDSVNNPTYQAVEPYVMYINVSPECVSKLQSGLIGWSVGRQVMIFWTNLEDCRHTHWQHFNTNSS